MNDFFTELDSDLGTKHTPHFSPVKTPVAPVAPVKANIHTISRPERQKPALRTSGQKPNDSASTHVTEIRSQMMQA